MDSPPSPTRKRRRWRRRSLSPRCGWSRWRCPTEAAAAERRDLGRARGSTDRTRSPRLSRRRWSSASPPSPDPVVREAVRCHVEVTRGCVGDGARAEGAKGQVLVEVTADIDALNLPVAPGTPPAAIGAAYDAAAVAARDVVGRARREIALVTADAIKGDLPRIPATGCAV